MGKIVHQSRITIPRENSPARKAMIEGFHEPVYYGVHGGIKKFVTFQGCRFRLPFLSEQDNEDILFAIEKKIGTLAVSFVRCAKDIQTLKSFIARHNAEMMIISKIEHSDALSHLGEILWESDGIIVGGESWRRAAPAAGAGNSGKDHQTLQSCGQTRDCRHPDAGIHA